MKTLVLGYTSGMTKGLGIARCAVILAALTVLVPASAQASAVQHFPWGTAIPVSTQAPAWFGPALYRRVVAAGIRGVPLSSIDTRAASHSPKPSGGGGGSAACLYSNGAGPSNSNVPTSPNGVERPLVGIGPGTWLISLFCTNVGGHPVPDGFAWCTANFVFQNGSTLGLGTAGHCGAKDALGSPVTAVVTPPPEVCADGGSCQPGVYAIGTFKIVHNNGLGDDFALISLYPQFSAWVRPTMPVFGGPTGAYLGGLEGVPGQTLTASSATIFTPAWYPAVVAHCGHGALVGTGGSCRTSAGLFAASTWYAWYGASAPGDSGSGVEVLGNYSAPANPVPAAADLTHIIILDAALSKNGNITEGPDQPAMVAGTQMSTILSIVGSSWKLVGGGVP
jgi:hypothetical protein